MAFSEDKNLQDLVPDILQLGIDTFTDEHDRAESDILRHLRIDWWERKGISGDLNRDYLTDSQFTRLSAYLVLWKYALPQLTNWVDGDRFQNMIDFYKARYGEELEQILRDGIEYDADDDDTIEQGEKKTYHSGRLTR
jgi:hypothetical protein